MALRVGVIGLGDVSTVHINAIKLSDKAELVAVCDIDETKMNLVEGANFYTDYNEMIEKENLDCVHLCGILYFIFYVGRYLNKKIYEMLRIAILSISYIFLFKYLPT